MTTVMQQRVTVLGSTGSIGVNTLDVIRRQPSRFELFALTASTNWQRLLTQIAEFKPRYAVLTDAACAQVLTHHLRQEGITTEVLVGEGALCEVASDERVDDVMAAIVGAAGLAPCLAAAKSGKRLLLANKEALVVGGDVFMKAVRAGGATLLPIDSEHSAIFQTLPTDRTTWGACIEKIILTASGGPFLKRDLASFASITPQEACLHPNWVMGQKISVDSATMMNKALEVIEAKYLFGVSLDQIEVLIHPQSVIHSMVQYKDKSILAQLGAPDMRVPIAYGLSYPHRMTSGAASLDLSALAAMTFAKVDPERFPSLSLAWAAMALPSGSIVLNAANEVAVQAFLEGRIRFTQIAIVNAKVLELMDDPSPSNLEEILAIDASARLRAQSVCRQVATGV